MKWLIIPAIATTFVSLHMSKHIQIQHGHGQAHVDSAQVAKAINLSKDQETRVKEVRFQLLRQFINAHMQGKDITPAEHEKMGGAAVAQIQKILTADQLKAIANQGGPSSLLDMMAAHMELFARVNVTKEQAGQLHEMLANLHKNTQGSEGHGDAQQMHEHMKKMHDDAFSKVHEILTPAQLQRLRELVENGKA